MPRRLAEDEAWDDDESDWGGDDDEGDEAGDDDEATVACPYCKRLIHEDAQRCPYCEQYVSAEDAPRSRKPWWIIVGALLCLYAVYRWITG
jgi:hypothetical protein